MKRLLKLFVFAVAIIIATSCSKSATTAKLVGKWQISTRTFVSSDGKETPYEKYAGLTYASSDIIEITSSSFVSDGVSSKYSLEGDVIYLFGTSYYQIITVDDNSLILKFIPKNSNGTNTKEYFKKII